METLTLIGLFQHCDQECPPFMLISHERVELGTPLPVLECLVLKDYIDELNEEEGVEETADDYTCLELRVLRSREPIEEVKL